MQAIQTKYLAPTNSRGARIKATCAAKSITVSYAYELSIEENHRLAAAELGESLEWAGLCGTLESGSLKDGSYVHVFRRECAK